jgi:subtilisin-like proprotein convertase family protein
MREIRAKSICLLIIAATFVMFSTYSPTSVQTVSAQGSGGSNVCNSPEFLAAQEAYLDNVEASAQQADQSGLLISREKFASLIKECYSSVDVNALTIDQDPQSHPVASKRGSSIRSAYVLRGYKWGGGTDFSTSSSPQIPGGTVYWSYMPSGVNSEDGTPISAISSLPTYSACFLTEIQNAFNAWQAVSNIQFVQVTDAGVASDAPTGYVGHIRIGAHAIDGASGVLAHGYYPPPVALNNTSTISGDLHFDVAENWQCSPGSGQIDFGIVALHEIGHTIGLNHEPSILAVMNPFYNSSLTGLQADDINGVRAIYGNNGVPGINIADILTGPYPAAKVVSGLGTNITDVNVTLTGLYHSFPSDMDILLVSPGGQAVVLMSDVCGTDANPLVNATITFDDSASTAIPTGACSSTTYRPANNGAGDPYHSPAPASGHTTTLSTFNGTNPNGTWNLYIVDDTHLDTGGLRTWSLSITATGTEPRPDTIGIFRPSATTFYLRNSNTTGFADSSLTFGASTFFPIAGDWDGDGIDTPGVYNRANGTFYLTNSTSNPAVVHYTFVLGSPNDQPIAGDWDGNGSDGVGVFRPSNGLIYLKNGLTTGFADFQMVLGIPGDVGIAGDWNGDGKDSPGVYRPSNAVFYLSNSACNCSVVADYQLALGLVGDTPFAGDWDGNGTSGVGVYRQSNGLTYIKNALTTGIADAQFTFGSASDYPIAGYWVRTGGSVVEAAPTFQPKP